MHPQAKGVGLVAMVVGAVCAIHCVSDAIGSQPAAIHGTTAVANDAFSLGVGVLFNYDESSSCSASLIEEDPAGGIGMAAAHCVFGVAQRCLSPTQIAHAQFLVSTTGSFVKGVNQGDDNYVVTRVVPEPNAFDNLSLCSSSSAISCSSNYDSAGITSSHDIVLFRFVLASGAGHHLPSFFGINPLHVITSLADGNTTATPTLIHVPLNQTADFGTRSALLFPVGWGDDDVPDDAQSPAQGIRRTGPTVLANPGPNWDETCDAAFVPCTKTLDSNSQCNGQSGQRLLQTLATQRPSAGDGGFSGVVTAAGDSGGPLLVEAGTQTGELSDLPGAQGTRVVIGVSSGTNLIGDGVTLPASLNQTMNFAPTFSAENGAWIEQTVTELLGDVDGDGVPGWRDNCPFVANPNQEDTNYLAEFQDELARGCPDYPNNACPSLHQLPSSAADSTVAAFHAVFPGDACDPAVSTETGKTGYTFGNGRTGPCDVIVLSGDQSSSHVDNGTTCEHQLDTQLRLASWIGDATGAAPLAGHSGSTVPAFCRCDGATTADPDQSAFDCQQTNRGSCVIANDLSFPGGGVIAGWQPMTEHNVGRPFPAVGTTFQERVGVYSDASTTRNWDMRADWSEFNTCQGLCVTPDLPTLEGVLWSHVSAFNGSVVYGANRAASTNLLTNLDNHYFPLFGRESYGLRVVEGPPPAFHFHVGGWFDGVDGDPGPGDPVQLPWLAVTSTGDVLRLLGSTGSLATSSFSSTALSLLAGVAAGTSDLLVGDDVGTGAMHGTTPNAVVIVQHGTTSVQGALRVGSGMAQGVTVSPVGTSPDPPDLRAYSAYDEKLYSLHVDPSGDTLSIVDVAAALGGVSSVATSTLVGPAPSKPLALVWDRFTQTLFVLDRLATGRAWEHKGVLRLLAVDPAAAQAYELWRTDDAIDLPDNASLSVSAQGEIVLALSDKNIFGATELMLMDAAGTPASSADRLGRLADVAYAVPAGVNLPVEPGLGDKVGMRVDIVERSDLSAGICGALWLKLHASGVLATAAATCKKKW